MSIRSMSYPKNVGNTIGDNEWQRNLELLKW